jgi:hypothetical protein|tara:strand:- start:617 stop:1168 length:552 start_codon:yes stop_codon:yes gene_type:complete
MATLIATAKSSTANSYCTLLEANSYHEKVRPDDEKIWLKQAETTRERLLMLATRIIDDHFDFLNYKTDTTQALSWPRQSVPVDGKWSKEGSITLLDPDTIPTFLINATSELARILIETDVNASAGGAGLSSVTMGSMSVSFNETDRMSEGVIRTSVYSLLRKYGSYKPSLNSGQFITSARVTR